MKKTTPYPTRCSLRRAPLAAAIFLAMPALAFAEQDSSRNDERALDVVTVTAQKRSENLQEVPISIQVLDGTALDELNVIDFNDVIDQLPAVTLRRDGEVPGNMQVYMRGVVSGGDGNHSASLPSVGVYLDEQPITTIRGPMDVHMVDIERIEALAGPQGTLYGASSQSGTLRIITNKPDPSGFAAGYAAELNTVHDGGNGNVAEGFVNLPMGESAAVRLVAWSRDDAGYIDNIHGSRVMPTSGLVSDNAALARKDFNDGDVVGARAALRLIFGDDWTVTPTVMGQKQHVHGSFGVDPNVGDLATTQYNPQVSKDSWLQSALTVQGRIGNFDLTYAFANLNRDFDTQSDYNDYAFWYDTLAGYGAYFYADNGDLVNPNQYIQAQNKYTKRSHELRLASPAENRVRFVGGVFWQKQHNDIQERYLVDGIASDIEVSGWPDTLWLTVQDRDDEDKAVFGELAFDFTDQLTGTVGARKYWVENSLAGFFGFGAGFSSGTGEAACFSAEPFDGAPCTNLDKTVKESDWLGKANLSYKVNDALMVYATWSEGFRPGGINRRGSLPPYLSDVLTNYEFGWKSSFGGAATFNGAVFQQDWDDFQFPILGQNGLTEIKNANQARIRGVEADLNWIPSYNWRVGAGIAYYDSKLTENYCGYADDNGTPVTACDDPEAPKGIRLPISAKFKGNLNARYSFDAGSLSGYVQGSLAHEGKRRSDLRVYESGILGDLEAYELFDLSTGFGRGNWKVDFYVKNVFDERAQLSKFTQCPEATCGEQTYTVVAQPRTIGLRFSQEF